MQGFSTKIFSNSTTVDDFNAKIQETNQIIRDNTPFWGLFTKQLEELTPAQYAFAAALTDTGSSAAAAIQKVQEYSTTFDSLQTALQNIAISTDLSVEDTNRFGIELGKTAAISAEAAGFADGLAQAVANNLPIDQAYAALQQFKAGAVDRANAALAAQTQATNNALVATQLFNSELVQGAVEAANSSVQTEALKFKQEQLYTAALAAATGMGATAQSANALAGQFGITTSAAYNLISALSQLELAKAKQALGVQAGGANDREDRLGTNADVIARAKDLELQKQLNSVKNANALAAADTAGKLQLERDALSRLTQGTVAYEQQLGKVQAAERALAAEKDKKGSGAPKLTPNEKINTKLLDDLDKFNDKFEDAERKHFEKLADIQADYEKKSLAQQRQNETTKRRNRADFYSNLTDAEGIDTGIFAAQYEEAFAKAQEIAQSGKAKLSAQFLELRQTQIQELLQLAQESAQIAEKQKNKKIDDKTAQAQLSYLQGRKKLIEDAQNEELQQLLAAGDENQNQLNEQLAAENEAYDKSTDKIVLASQRSADAKITHAQRSKIAVSAENKELAAQADLYDRIAAKNGGQVPLNAARQVTQNKPVTASDSTAQPVDISATIPIPVQSAEALLVKQSEFFLVHDQDVITTLGDVSARLEGRLLEIVSAVNAAKDTISNAVRSVESAISRTRGTVASVVQS